MATDFTRTEAPPVEGKDEQMQRMRELTAAFQTFTQKTSQLEGAYQNLQDKFNSVNLALEETNRILNDKVAELALTSDYLHSILGHMAQGILFVRLDGTVGTCNPASEQILGIREKQITEQPFWNWFEDTAFGFSLRESLETKHALDLITISKKTEEGSLQHLEITTTFVLEGSPALHGLIILIRDVTEMRRLQVAAERDDRMKELGELAACVAHEIRNPLGGIKGFASLLVRDLEDRPEAKNMAQYIVDGTKALNRLVSSVLHYARPMQAQLEVCKLNKLLEDVCQLVEADSKLSRSVKIIRCLETEDCQVRADAEMLKSAVLNLMVNGIQAMPNGGSLTVRATSSRDEVLIVIEDTGTGIPEELKEKIFTPFFTTKESGNGFGLAEVHRVVELHEGVLDFESEAGQGTRFLIRLPRLQEKKQRG